MMTFATQYGSTQNSSIALKIRVSPVHPAPSQAPARLGPGLTNCHELSHSSSGVQIKHILPGKTARMCVSLIRKRKTFPCHDEVLDPDASE